MLAQSYFGALYTRRDDPDDVAEARNTVGVDFRLATSRFRGSQNLSATGWLLHAPQLGTSSGGNALGMLIEYPNDRWAASFGARQIERNFDPAVGFVTRRDFRRYTPSLTFGPRPRGHRYVRRFQFGSTVDVLTDLRSQLLERSVNLMLVDVQLHTQDSWRGVDANARTFDAPFEISRGIILPLGATYSYTRLQLRGQTANRRVLAINGRFETGSFYSGTRHQTVMQLTLRARPGYIVYMNGEWNQVTLAEGRFASNLYRVIAETQFTPFIALVNNVQFDTTSRVLGWQSRFRWIVTPGSDLYVVYTHNWLEDPLRDRFATLDRRAATKALYTHRF